MKILTIMCVLLIAVGYTGCYYDKSLLDQNAICDTAIVTYSGSVKPVLTAYCLGCHSGPNAPLRVRLDNYTDVRSQVLNGKLLGSITHSPGFIPMPPGNKLSDCNIAKIRKWIVTGSPNN